MPTIPAGERKELAMQALKMSVRGATFVEIGRQLSITRGLASNLVNEELAKASEHRSSEKERSKAIAHYTELIRTGWSGYNQCNPATNAAIGYLHSIRAAQERIDKLTGAEAPLRFEDVTEAEVVWDDAELDYLAIEAAEES